MATYYFDSIDGNDANAGTSWGAAWKGDSKQIKDYIVSNDTVWLRGSWSNQIIGSISGVSNFSLRVHADGAVLDCRTRHSSGWSNVVVSGAGTKVWKKSYAYQVHRLFLGSGNATGFTEGSDAAKRVIVSTTGSWTSTAATDAQVAAVLDAGAVNQSQFWYWDGISGTLYVRSTNNSTNPDTAYGGVWTCDGSDSGVADRRRWAPVLFNGCSGIFWGPVEIRGAVKPLIIQNTSGTFEPFLTDFPHYQFRALGCEGADPRPSITINNPRILLRRPFFDDDIMQSQPSGNFNDGNGQRQQGGADTVSISGAWNQWHMIGGTIEGMVHGGVSFQAYDGARITDGLVQGTYFDGTNSKYARAFNFQSNIENGITSFVIERVTVHGQSIQSQVNCDNLTIRDSVWRNGRNGWWGDGNTPVYNDKYNPTQNWAGRWRNSNAIDFSRIDGRFGQNITVDNCLFYGQHDAVFSYVHYGSGQNSLNTRVRNCHFIRVPALAGSLLGNQVFWTDNEPYTITLEGTNKHSGYGTVPAGTGTLSAGELALSTARARAQRFTFSPATATPAAGSTQSVTMNVLDVANAPVADFAGTVSTTSAAGTATAAAPTAATGASGQVAVTVTGVAQGSATITLRAVQGATSATLPVAVAAEGAPGGNGGGTVTGVRVVQSAIATAEAAGAVSCAIAGLAAQHVLYAFVGGYFDGATGVTLSDSRTPAGTWTAIEGDFHTGGTSSSIGVFALSSPISGGTPNITVTATPTKSPAATNAYLSLVLVEVADAGSVQADAFAYGQSATPNINLASITAPALVLAAASQSGFALPTMTAGGGYTMLHTKAGNAGIGVAALKVNANGDNDPSFSLASTVAELSASDIEWPMVAVVIGETVVTAPTVTTATLPGATAGSAYSQTLAATGTAPITWAVTAGALPVGLALNASTGAITGTPTTVGVAAFTATATNAAGADVRALTITVAAAATQPVITTPSLPPAVVGDAYSQPLAATGTAPITWALASGALPGGLALNPVSGVIAGTPTTPGTFGFTATATNTAGFAARALSIQVDAPPEVPPSPGSGRWVRIPRDSEIWVRVPRDT